MAANNAVHDLISPLAYGHDECIGQFSESSASEIRRLGAAMALPPGAVVLAIGCGTAPVACFLARESRWRTVRPVHRWRQRRDAVWSSASSLRAGWPQATLGQRTSLTVGSLQAC